MDRFGYKDTAENRNGKGIHYLENILTLDMVVRDHFNGLRFCFKHTVGILLFHVKCIQQFQDELLVYGVVARRPFDLTGCRTPVKYTTKDPENLLPPSPEYLGIHAACAKIAHMLGAGEYIDQALRELEDTTVLSEDDASAELLLLEHPLTPSS